MLLDPASEIHLVVTHASESSFIMLSVLGLVLGRLGIHEAACSNITARHLSFWLQTGIPNLHTAWKQCRLKAYRFVVRPSRIAGLGVFCTGD